MCGIFCSLSSCHESKQCSDTLEVCLSNLKSRGPDCFQTQSCELLQKFKIFLAASVLQTQGNKLCAQPYVNAGNILCWNGDVFGGPLRDELLAGQLCDTEVVSKHLCDGHVCGTSPAEVFNKIDGPYSFVYYNRQTHTLWFGRDPVGRHSLLYGFSESPFSFTISSVAHSSLAHFKELPAIGLFEINLGSVQNLNDLVISIHPWEEMIAEQLSDLCNDFPVGIEVRHPICHENYIFRPLLSTLSEPSEKELQPIRQSSQASAVEDKMILLSRLDTYSENVIRLCSLLEAAVEVRVKSSVPLCQDCISQGSLSYPSCCHAKVAILFSGGLDSAILARLADKFIPQNEPIDLLNVAFEKTIRISNDVSGKKNASSMNSTLRHADVPHDEESKYNVPDRRSGRRSLRELQSLCPHRQWNFVEINVPAIELQAERMNCIGHLIHPLKTILDDSLGCALWFAARGKGKLSDSDTIYQSPARIIVSGIGADEQFGGYMRHRTTFRNHGWEALHSQLQMEMERIPSRNLGRDDRVISHHGRQLRVPFLDENIIKFAKSLPPWQRCFPSNELPCGVGDKLLLRLVAVHIGLQGAASLPKRALQFGSRIANSKENATDISDRL